MISKNTIIAAASSIFCGAVMFFIFTLFGRGGVDVPFTGQAYALLAADEPADEITISESLAAAGIKGVISESTQEVALDDFGVMKMVPLYSYRNEIESFDPREDGYADKLKAFFSRDGKRFFFFPVDKISSNTSRNLKEQISPFLEDISFTISVPERKISSLWYYVILAASSFAACFLSRKPGNFIFGLPVLLAFGGAGLYGFAFSALLAGIWELIRWPLREISAARGYGHLFYGAAGYKGFHERLKPFKKNLLLVLLLVIIFACLLPVSAASGFSPLPQTAGFLFFFLLVFAVSKKEAERAKKNNHIPFTPVPLQPSRAKTFSFSPFLLPFAAGALFALFIPRIFGSAPQEQSLSGFTGREYLVTKDDYERHIAFQSTFSYRPLYTDSRNLSQTEVHGQVLNNDDYLRYYIGEDGLIAGSANAGAFGRPLAEGSGREEAPPFPLETLVEFLINYSNATPSDSPGLNTAPYKFNGKELISVILIFALCILDFIRIGKVNRKKNIPVLRDKRIAA